jgi:hypothetical protein
VREAAFCTLNAVNFGLINSKNSQHREFQAQLKLLF